MNIRKAIRGLGKTLIAAGVLILLFVAYQLWGTGLAEARSQRRLEREFRAQQPQLPTTTSTTAAGTPSEPTTTTTARPRPVLAGDAVAIIEIPRIGVDKVVIEGVTLDHLKKGPGHYPKTPLPGQPGNAAIAGHRTTYGAPFSDLDDLEPGDEIRVETHQGKFRYEVTRTREVSPKEVSVLDPTPDNQLTLTTCHPRYSAARRLVVVAALTGEAVDVPPVPPPPDPATTTPSATTPASPGIGGSSSDEDPAGLSGRGASNLPAIFWGLLAALIWLGSWLLARRWRRWPAYALSTPVFLVVLFVFFENFSRLLPANY